LVIWDETGNKNSSHSDGSTHGRPRNRAKALDISHMMVAHIWTRHGLKPHRLARYMASDDPDFETKAAEVIGLS
jgi:hypothetical protein